MKHFIIGIRFQSVGKIYHFDASAAPEIQVGDFAVVETTRGRQLGKVVEIVKDPPPPPEGSWKSIQRQATPRDMVQRQLWQKKELEATINCRARLAELKLSGVKIVNAEFSFDGTRLSYIYSVEGDGKVDLNQLSVYLQRIYPNTKIEMRQVGPRDVAKLLGGMGACGMANRCCSMFITDFSPISIKMAKEQGISLAPSEITGMCGRLRCCLVYEYEQYVEARKSLPKRGKRIITPNGEAKVLDVNPLKQLVLVELENGTQAEFPSHVLEPWDETEALRRKSTTFCERHGDGPCDCQNDQAYADENQELIEQSEPVNPVKVQGFRDMRTKKYPTAKSATGLKKESHVPAQANRNRQSQRKRSQHREQQPRKSTEGKNPSQKSPPKSK